MRVYRYGRWLSSSTMWALGFGTLTQRSGLMARTFTLWTILLTLGKLNESPSFMKLGGPFSFRPLLWSSSCLAGHRDGSAGGLYE